MGMTIHPTQEGHPSYSSLAVAAGFYFCWEGSSCFLTAMTAHQLMEAMLFDVELDGGNLHHLMAIGVRVKSAQLLPTTVASLGIIVADSFTLF